VLHKRGPCEWLADLIFFLRHRRTYLRCLRRNGELLSGGDGAQREAAPTHVDAGEGESAPLKPSRRRADSGASPVLQYFAGSFSVTSGEHYVSARVARVGPCDGDR
jgi:hypothetical protein